MILLTIEEVLHVPTGGQRIWDAFLDIEKSTIDCPSVAHMPSARHRPSGRCWSFGLLRNFPRCWLGGLHRDAIEARCSAFPRIQTATLRDPSPGEAVTQKNVL